MSYEPKPTSIVIFGASGDLTRRKLIPALYDLFRKKRLIEPFHVFGLAWTKWDTAEFRTQMTAAIQEFDPEDYDESLWQAFVPNLHYISGSFTDPDAYAELDQQLVAAEQGDANRLYYLATPPRFFANIMQQLGAKRMVQETAGWRRVIVEKPFGTDLASAQALNRELHTVLYEDQIYRIDHYLAKETVQNLMVFRFGNSIFEPLWNRNFINHVQITAVESVDVGHRAGYYDQAGVLRDMFQNHLMQLLSLVGMEPPASFSANAIRNEKVKVLSAVRPINVGQDTVRGQYRDYLDAPDVTDGSQTATYAALKLYIDNWRWRGVPFYLRSGKALEKKQTEVIIQFKKPPHMMFPMPDEKSIKANYLSLCIQPDEGMHLRFEVKVPDTEADMRSVNMEFHYEDEFNKQIIPEAYERLLLEALEGDASLFTRGDSIERSWEIIEPVINGWEREGAPPLSLYERGSWGPMAADELLGRNGRFWRHGCGEH
ncbi:MAG: glucose-6-phosphate dehydrogenase [Chloroflexota bacterium]